MTAPSHEDEYDAERDMWASWWLAHHEIGAEVKAGRRELPKIFIPRDLREGERL